MDAALVYTPLPCWMHVDILGRGFCLYVGLLVPVNGLTSLPICRHPYVSVSKDAIFVWHVSQSLCTMELLLVRQRW